MYYTYNIKFYSVIIATWCSFYNHTSVTDYFKQKLTMFFRCHGTMWNIISVIHLDWYGTALINCSSKCRNNLQLIQCNCKCMFDTIMSDYNIIHIEEQRLYCNGCYISNSYFVVREVFVPVLELDARYNCRLRAPNMHHSLFLISYWWIVTCITWKIQDIHGCCAYQTTALLLETFFVWLGSELHERFVEELPT